jgi:hypothetical protein
VEQSVERSNQKKKKCTFSKKAKQWQAINDKNFKLTNKFMFKRTARKVVGKLTISTATGDPICHTPAKSLRMGPPSSFAIKDGPTTV